MADDTYDAIVIGTSEGGRFLPVDLAAVRERKRSMVGGARENYASRLAQDGLDLDGGRGRRRRGRRDCAR
jgi:hypothetical protein